MEAGERLSNGSIRDIGVCRRSSVVHLLIMIAIYVVCALLVDPRGEFPLNDDWSYTRSAFRLAQGQGLHVDEWAAPSLVGQAFYGAMLARLFGPGFLVLRLSTLALSCGIAVILRLAVRRAGCSQALSWVVALAWIFNPVAFCLSFTYMTEVPFVFFVSLAAYLYERHLCSSGYATLCGCAIALGYAFLIRQTALLFIFALICSLLLERQSSIRDRLRRATLTGAITGCFVSIYYFWLGQAGGSTPATQRKFDLLHHLTLEQILGNSLGLLFYVSFLLIPVWIYLLADWLRLIGSLDKKARIGILCGWALVAAFALGWFHLHYQRFGNYFPSAAYHSQMPFLLNVLYDTGLGPVTLDPTYFRVPATPTHPRIWFCLTLLSAAGVVVIGSFWTAAILPNNLRRADSVRRSLVLFSLPALLCLASFEVVFSHLQEGGLFDRHIIAALVPVYLSFVALHEAPKANSRLPILATIAATAMFSLFSITATHDYFAWNRLRWEMGNELLARKIDPLTISAGFEFNAWHNYDIFRARGNVGSVYYWWFDKREYLISMAVEDGYTIIEEKKFLSWLHGREFPLYLLKKS